MATTRAASLIKMNCPVVAMLLKPPVEDYGTVEPRRSYQFEDLRYRVKFASQTIAQNFVSDLRAIRVTRLSPTSGYRASSAATSQRNFERSAGASVAAKSISVCMDRSDKASGMGAGLVLRQSSPNLLGACGEKPPTPAAMRARAAGLKPNSPLYLIIASAARSAARCSGLMRASPVVLRINKPLVTGSRSAIFCNAGTRPAQRFQKKMARGGVVSRSMKT